MKLSLITVAALTAALLAIGTVAATAAPVPSSNCHTGLTKHAGDRPHGH